MRAAAGPILWFQWMTMVAVGSRPCPAIEMLLFTNLPTVAGIYIYIVGDPCGRGRQILGR